MSRRRQVAALPGRSAPDTLPRQALRSTTPIVVQDLAALLVQLDQPWCRRELTSALMGAVAERLAGKLADDFGA